MSSPFLGEIKMFAGNFAPRGYAFCNGAIFSIAQNTALFSLLGTTYGGNGQTTFALPNLQDQSPMFWGQGPGLTPRVIGETGGQSSVTLLTTQIPSHSHTIGVSSSPGTESSPNSNRFAVLGRGRAPLYTSQAPSLPMAPLALAGGGTPHNNRQPYLGLYFIIATEGIFPARN